MGRWQRLSSYCCLSPASSAQRPRTLKADVSQRLRYNICLGLAYELAPLCRSRDSLVSPSRPLLSSDRNVHRLVAETSYRGPGGCRVGGWEFLGIKVCLNGCHLLKDETKQQDEEAQPGPQRSRRRRTHPMNFPKGKPGVRTQGGKFNVSPRS